MSLPRNAAFNLGGALLPAIAALLTVPVLIAHLGSTEYGLLFLVTSIVGYFALLDVNATAGSVKFIAQHHQTGDMLRLRRVFSFSLQLYLGIGAVGGLLLYLLADRLARDVFSIPAELQAEAMRVLRWAGLAFLVGQLQTYLQSVPQALQRYDITGRLEAGFGTAASVATMLAAWAGLGLLGIVLVRLLLSLLNVGLLWRRIGQLLPAGRWARPDRATVAEVAGFSAYAYLARLAAISAAHTDKLIIAAMVDMRSLAWYSVPFLIVNRVNALSFRLAQVMFPRASALAAAGRGEQLASNYLDACRYVAALNALLLLVLVTAGPEVIRYWAGGDFGTAALQVMLLLALAAFMDSLTNVPSLVNDGLGHPRVSGVAAVLRAALGFAAAWLAVRQAGIAGAALAQGMVSLVATLGFLAYVHGRTVPVPLALYWRQVALPLLPLLACAGALGLWSASRTVLPLPTLAGLLLALAAAAAAYAWLVVIRPPHRQRLRAGWPLGAGPGRGA